MNKSKTVIVVDPSNDSTMKFEELCALLRTTPYVLQEFISYEIIHPQGKSESEWIFTMEEVVRVKKAMRLHRDLEINLAGVAVVLDLLKELEELREKMQLIERHYR